MYYHSSFTRFINSFDGAEALYTSLENLADNDVEGVRVLGQQIREQLKNIPIPIDIEIAIIEAWKNEGTEHPYAIRSSATAEDLPDASFAGQQDTYLNIIGKDALLENVRNCWASLFTDRAILYRAKNNFSHREVQLSVVVQRMVLPQVSGIMFTADPISNNRHIVSIDASYGLGEALVSGLVSADLYKVDKRNQAIIATQIAEKKLAIYPLPEGGTYQEDLDNDMRHAQVLKPKQIAQLAALGHQIETHYNKPQDIEWCIDEGNLYIVQSRPITSLFPLPEPKPKDDNLHIYLSFSHAQVMTDPMPPLALSIWQLVLPFGKPHAYSGYNPYMHLAAGRIYLNPGPLLHNPIGKRFLPKALTMADKLIADEVGDFVQQDAFQSATIPPNEQVHTHHITRWLRPIMLKAQKHLWWHRPEGSLKEAETRIEAYFANVQGKLALAKPGVERLQEARNVLCGVLHEAFQFIPSILIAGALAKTIIAKLTQGYADPNDVEALGQGLSGNVTTEMDLAVGDLADIARQSPALLKHLSTGDVVTALETASDVPGSADFLKAWHQFLAKYGMRGPSEIDITRPRWQEEPSSLLQVIVSNLIHNKEGGTHRTHHKRLAAAGEAAGKRLVEAAKQAPLGSLRAIIVKRMVRVTRNLMPIREHPKFLIIRIMAIIKDAVLEVGEMLHQANRLDEIKDVWYFDLLELISVLNNPSEDLRPRVAQRKADLIRHRDMTPPRIITSDGEIPNLQHANGDIPAGAIPGSPVSAGIIEGRAKVVLDPQTEMLKPGDILVAPFTDPGWTPLFINAAGLVMEVGGLMTHGSVVAREYGIPAVVNIPDATKRIQTGQLIRVDGSQGYVEILEEIEN